MIQNKITKAILSRAKGKGIPLYYYAQARNAKTLKEFYEVIEDNIGWYGKYKIITEWEHFFKYAPQKKIKLIKKEDRDYYWTWIDRYENGDKEYEVNYKNGEPHGKETWWDKNGQKEWEKNYQNGELHGKVHEAFDCN